jgi:hypothetical protein
MRSAKITPTPASDTTAPTTSVGRMRSIPVSVNRIAITSGWVANSTAASPPGTRSSPRYTSA